MRKVEDLLKALRDVDPDMPVALFVGEASNPVRLDDVELDFIESIEKTEQGNHKVHMSWDKFRKKPEDISKEKVCVIVSDIIIKRSIYE